jgi:pimeloyl-ACP methyl ester carboxylesterase
MRRFATTPAAMTQTRLRRPLAGSPRAGPARADEFDWPAQEAALARLLRFRLPLGALRIHFVHARAAAPAGPVLPLVLSHGWPDSFWRYAKVIPLLSDRGAHGADPADAFDVVVPDMPGCGYSDRPPGPPQRGG